MARSYGIEICKNTLKFLSNEKNIADRLAKAFSEANVMRYEKGENGDLSKQLFDKRDKLYHKYLSLKEKNDVKVLRNLAEELVSLCVEIIENNAREIERKEYNWPWTLMSARQSF